MQRKHTINQRSYKWPKWAEVDSHVSRRTVWSGIFRYHRASEAWLAAADPSRCSAAPRGWALRLPAHTSDNTRRGRQQSSALWLTGGGYPAGRLPRWLCVRCTCRPRRSQRSQGQAFHGGETPIRWDPPFYLGSTGVKSRPTRQAQEGRGIFSLSHVHKGGKKWVLRRSDSSSHVGHALCRMWKWKG